MLTQSSAVRVEKKIYCNTLKRLSCLGLSHQPPQNRVRALLSRIVDIRVDNYGHVDGGDEPQELELPNRDSLSGGVGRGCCKTCRLSPWNASPPTPPRSSTNF